MELHESLKSADLVQRTLITQVMVKMMKFGTFLLMGLCLLLGFPGCSGAGASEDPSEDRIVVEVLGLLPSWNLEEMVARSDAIVIGRVSRELGSKEFPEPFGRGGEPRYAWRFLDYELEVETVLKPLSLQSEVVALMIGAGIVPAREGIEVAGLEDPELAVGERILVFLESVQDEPFTGVPHVVPSGFDRERYYRVILSSNYSKLVPDGDLWRDVRSQGVVSLRDIEEAVVQKPE